MSKQNPTRRQLLLGASALALGSQAHGSRVGLEARRAGAAGDGTEPAAERAPGGPRPSRPNLLFLIDDQHRWDILGAAGDAHAHTPALDRLAGEGTRFSSVYCQVPLCVPARQCLITGTWAHEHTSFGNIVGDFPAGQKTFVAHLRAHGYQTAMIGKSHFNDADFERVEEKAQMFRQFARAHPGAVNPGKHAIDDERDPLPASLRSANPHYLEAASSQGEPVFFMEQEVVRRSAAFLDGLDPARPFFLWASFVDPHPPRFPPKRWLDLYREAELPLPKRLSQEAFEGLFEFQRALFESSGMSRVGEAELRGLVRAYYASVAWSDHNIGALLQELDRRGLAEDTLVVYTSDHGESLGEHGMIGKVNFFEGPERVPLVIRHSGRLAAGAHVERVVTHLDLMAGLPELLGVPAFEGARGRSLAPLLTPLQAGDEAAESGPPAARPSWEDLAISELYLGDKNYEEIPGDQLSLMVRKDALKYVEGRPGEAALFDLDEDPAEERNLIADAAHKGALQELRDRAREHRPKSFFARVSRLRGGKKRKNDDDEDD